MEDTDVSNKKGKRKLQSMYKTVPSTF